MERNVFMLFTNMIDMEKLRAGVTQKQASGCLQTLTYWTKIFSPIHILILRSCKWNPVG